MKSQVKESGAEFFSKRSLILFVMSVHKNIIKIREMRMRQGLKRMGHVKTCGPRDWVIGKLG